MLSNMTRLSLFLATYADCGEDILELVDQRDEARVVHVDPNTSLSACFLTILFPHLSCSRVGVGLRHGSRRQELEGQKMELQSVGAI